MKKIFYFSILFTFLLAFSWFVMPASAAAPKANPEIAYTIAGNAGVAGAVLSWDEGGAHTATADSNGDYLINVSSGWSGTITPALSGYEFTPSSRSYSSVMGDALGEDFTATAHTPTPTATHTESPTLTMTSTETPTPTITSTHTSTKTRTRTPTKTRTRTPTKTITPTLTRSPTKTPTPIKLPIPQAPSGPTSDSTPLYKWTKVTNATSYQYQLLQGTTLVYSRTVPASACVTTCTDTPTTPLASTTYRWRVRAMVGGVWQPFSAYKAFAVYGPGVKIIYKLTYPSSSGSYRYVVGEIINATTSYVRSVKIVVNFFNNSQLVGTDYTYTYANTIAPNARACFSMLMDNPPSWTSYSFEDVTFRSATKPKPNLTVLNHSGGVYTYGYKILGQVRNDDPLTVTFAAAIATLYNAAGTPIACDFNYLSNSKLEPGQTSSFEITSDLPAGETVATYKLIADGY